MAKSKTAWHQQQKSGVANNQHGIARRNIKQHQHGNRQRVAAAKINNGIKAKKRGGGAWCALAAARVSRHSSAAKRRAAKRKAPAKAKNARRNR